MACVSKAFNKQSTATYNFFLIYYFMFMFVTEFHKILTSNQNQNYLKVKQRSVVQKTLLSLLSTGCFQERTRAWFHN